jgi:geranylgeranyl diphosphate synthase type II
LIQAALEGGALIGNAPTADRSLLSTIGREIGIAFQLVDDLLDVIGETALLGKSVGSDAKHNKTTAISWLGISKTQERIAELYNSALHRLSQLSVKTDSLLPLLQEMIERQK